MFPRLSDFLPDSLDMSDFGNLTDFHDFSKDMFVTNAMVSMTDADLLEEFDCKDDMKPFFSSEVDDAFDLPLRGSGDDETFELPLRVTDGDDDRDSSTVPTNPLCMLVHEKPSEPPEFMALTPSPTCTDGLDLAPLYSSDSGRASPPLEGAASSLTLVVRSDSAPSLASASPLTNRMDSRRWTRSLSSIDTISSPALRISSPLTSPSSRPALSTSRGGPLFSILSIKDNGSAEHVLNDSLRIDLSPRVDQFASIRGKMGNLPYQIPSIQRSQSSHALGQFGMTDSSSCGKDGFSFSAVRQAKTTHSNSNPSSEHLGSCCPQAITTSSVAPMRRVFSTGDLKSFYGRSTEIANKQGVAGGKIGNCTSEERKMKLHRYRQKRTERNFSKKIQYACRKTLADGRPRVRGRFARTDEIETGELPLIDEYEEVSNQASRIIPDPAYSVRNNSVIMASNVIPQYWNSVGMKVAM